METIDESMTEESKQLSFPEFLDKSFEALFNQNNSLHQGLQGYLKSNVEDKLEELKKQIEENKPIAAICAAPAVVFSHHNLLGNNKATCYPAEKFISKISNYQTDAVVSDGNVITSKG